MSQGYFCSSIIVFPWRHFTIYSTNEYFTWHFFNSLALTLANTRCWLLSKLSHFVLTPRNPRCQLLGAFLYYIFHCLCFSIFVLHQVLVLSIVIITSNLPMFNVCTCAKLFINTIACFILVLWWWVKKILSSQFILGPRQVRSLMLGGQAIQRRKNLNLLKQSMRKYYFLHLILWVLLFGWPFCSMLKQRITG